MKGLSDGPDGLDDTALERALTGKRSKPSKTRVTRTPAQRLASIDATIAATKDRDDCDPRKGFNRRPELTEEQWPEYRAEYQAVFVSATCEVTP